MPSRSNLHF